MTGERIRLHSAGAKPGLFVVTAIYAMGPISALRSVLDGSKGSDPLAFIALIILGGLLVLKMWRLYQPVYMTREGIELARPARVVPWRLVGDAFRVPMTGSLAPMCCIGINDAENWDLYFLGRNDFDDVVRRFRTARQASSTVSQVAPPPEP